MHDVEEELILDLKSDRGRVQSAILLYLLIAIGLNFYVWTRFVVLHRHGVHAFPLGERVERFGDLIRFTGKEQLWGDRRMVDYEHLRGTLFPKNYPALSVVVYLFLLQVCAPYAAQVFVAGFLGAMGVACTLLWLRVRRLAGYAWYVGAAIFLTGFFGWGTEMVLIRGNIEGLLWVFVCLGAALYEAALSRVGGGIRNCVLRQTGTYFVVWVDGSSSPIQRTLGGADDLRSCDPGGVVGNRSKSGACIS